MTFAGGPAFDPALVAAVEAQLALVRDALAGDDNGRAYLNFAERGGSAADSYDEATYARLARLRSEYDPDGMFVASHEIASR